MVPGGPGNPSAPGRPGRPGGPCEQMGQESWVRVHKHRAGLWRDEGVGKYTGQAQNNARPCGMDCSRTQAQRRDGRRWGLRMRKGSWGKGMRKELDRSLMNNGKMVGAGRGVRGGGQAYWHIILGHDGERYLKENSSGRKEEDFHSAGGINV